MSDAVPPYVPPRAIEPDDEDIATLLAQTVSGQTYPSAVLYQRYVAIVSSRQGGKMASIDKLVKRLSAEGWKKGRKNHGTVRVWTRP